MMQTTTSDPMVAGVVIVDRQCTNQVIGHRFESGRASSRTSE
jgi:hypothetical protein